MNFGRGLAGVTSALASRETWRTLSVRRWRSHATPLFTLPEGPMGFVEHFLIPAHRFFVL